VKVPHHVVIEFEVYKKVFVDN